MVGDTRYLSQAFSRNGKELPHNTPIICLFLLLFCAPIEAKKKNQQKKMPTQSHRGAETHEGGLQLTHPPVGRKHVLCVTCVMLWTYGGGREGQRLCK